MKTLFIIFIIFLSFNICFGQSSYLRINSKELNETPLILDGLIERHIKIMKRRLVFKAKNKVLIVRIMPNASYTRYLDSSKIATLYPDTFLLDRSNNTDVSYNVLVQTYHNSDIELKKIVFRDSNNVFYFKKDNWDVFIVSTLKLVSLTKNKEKEFIFCDKRKSKEIIWYENRATSYSINMMFNSVYEIRYSELYKKKNKYYSRAKKWTYMENKN